eukprot:TRINITY_DN1186_c2_g1_i3.p1 TRINITY_DN1186_c2_g1~~TRINITY_DN1186_c2_g1_i3.p1  ORF type:complete len:215 (-),score=65.79 TRINITY_DN1186_c2_g1_i3:1375-2019(-)
MRPVIFSLLSGLASGHNLHRRDTGASYSAGGISSAAAGSSGGGSSFGASYDAGGIGGGAGGGYSAPSSSYAEPSGGSGLGDYGGGSDFDFPIEAIILPLIALLGLALLFPTITSVAVVPPGRRRKRSEETNEEIGPMGGVLSRVNDIYYSVVESEECMQRIACEVGGLAKDFGLSSSPVSKMIDPLVSKKYKTYYKQFTSGEDCQKIKCGSFSL